MTIIYYYIIFSYIAEMVILYCTVDTHPKMIELYHQFRKEGKSDLGWRIGKTAAILWVWTFSPVFFTMQIFNFIKKHV